MNRLAIILIFGFACFSVGCSKEADKQNIKATVKVHGVVTVNGERPPWKVQLEARPEGAVDTTNPTISIAETQEDGSFEFSTYAAGDGVPVGAYALLAKSQVATSLITGGVDPPDKFGHRYDTVKKAPKKFEIKDGDQALDLGTIELVGPKKK